jgi:hypothetical protein
MAAWYSPTAAILQRVSPARFKLGWNRPVRVALALPRIDVGTIPARHGVATASVALILSRCLVLRAQKTVRIAQAIAGT